MVTIVELIDPPPYNNQSPVYVRLVYTVIYMSDRILIQANPNPRFPPQPELPSLVRERRVRVYKEDPGFRPAPRGYAGTRRADDAGTSGQGREEDATSVYGYTGTL